MSAHFLWSNWVEIFQALDQGIIVVILTVLGGIIVKLLDIYQKKDHEDITDTLAVRSQIIKELDSLKDEINELKTQLDDWKNKYWEQIKINAEQNALILKLRTEVDYLTSLLKTNRIVVDGAIENFFEVQRPEHNED